MQNRYKPLFAFASYRIGLSYANLICSLLWSGCNGEWQLINSNYKLRLATARNKNYQDRTQQKKIYGEHTDKWNYKKKMKKIVHLSSVHPSYDTRIFVKECASLAKAGYDVTLIVPHNRDEDRQGVKIRHVEKLGGGRLKRMLLTSWKVFKKAWGQNADIYHFHDPELIPAGILLRLKGAKVIYDVHEDVPKQILSKDWIPGYLRYPVAMLIALMEWVSTRFFFSGIAAATPTIAKRFPDKKTVTIQNFPIREEIKLAKDPIPFAKRDNKVIYIGGIAKIRGIVQCVEAMAKVNQKNASLLLGGKISSASFAQELENTKGWDRIDQLGWLDRDEVVKQLQISCAGLVLLHPRPNYIDSLPVKMFEYMAAGLPVIASDFPLWREIIGENKCGLLVDPMNSEAIANAIDWIFSHPEDAQQMGLEGLKTVQTIYNWGMEEQKLLTFYKGI